MRMFNPLEHPICFTPIRRLAPSTWTGHTPFAMFLTSILKPRVIVELGTYYGTSYCAFCQAIKELQWPARCFAVDTWEGDAQSRYYGVEVLADLKRYHDSLYSDFSTLMRSTFDDASHAFADETIDLLHIDGFHSYETVKHDFSTWLPKLSSAAVVLFHDTTVLEPGFGVWKFWDEVRREHPHFEFTHEHGLGVLAVGTECPEPFNEFLRSATCHESTVTGWFSRLGDMVKKTQEQKEIERCLDNKSAEMRRQELHLEELAAQLKQESQTLYGKQWMLQSALAKVENPALADDNSHNENDQPARLVIGIVTFNNSAEQIGQVLRSVELAKAGANGLPVEIEVFVMDNGKPTEWRADWLQAVRFASGGNVGFGNAINNLMTIAFSKPSVRWFLCLNPDGQLHREALRELLVSSGDNPGCLIEARQFPEEHNKQYDARTLETPWASGACLLIPRKIFQDLGGFDPKLFMYLEDVDLSWRARAAGYRVKIAPRAIFGHAVLNRQFNAEQDKIMLLSGRYLASKWQNPGFVRWTETELVARGHYASLEGLPGLPHAPETQESIAPDVADFTQFFSFSKPRW